VPFNLERAYIGLKKAFFVNMTEIQMQSLPVSLKGKDVLGAARTGSGKTLSFLVPVLEILYRRKWGSTDGLGALVISPTRELVRTFKVNDFPPLTCSSGDSNIRSTTLNWRIPHLFCRASHRWQESER
jgi:superfamily II DNA/RNA helicase